jgi:hypothetical protein
MCTNDEEAGMTATKTKLNNYEKKLVAAFSDFGDVCFFDRDKLRPEVLADYIAENRVMSAVDVLKSVLGKQSVANQ